MVDEFHRKAAGLGMKFRAPLAHPSTANAPPRQYRAVTKDGLDIEYDIPIPTRYGNLFADIFRPSGSNTKLAPIICYTPYGKQERYPTNELSLTTSMKFYSETLLHVPSHLRRS